MALKEILRRTTVLDRLILILLLAGGAASLPLAAGSPGERVVVEQQGRIIFTAPLSEERRAVLPGPLGETVLAIRKEGVRVVSATCPEKTCMGMGEAGRRGEILACVPNGLLVRIEGGREKEGRDYDLLSR